MTDSTRTTDQSQQSSSRPWDAAMPLVNNLLSRYGSANTAVTPGQTSALNNLQASTASLPNFTPQATSAVNSLFSSNNAPQVGMLQSAYDTQRGNLSPLANPANLNPYNTPGLSDALGRMTSDITKDVKSQYAAAGRDPSGAGSFAGSLGRGLSQGLAPALLGQYNTNVGNLFTANQNLMGGAGSTASGISGLNQTDLQNRIAGITSAGAVPGVATAPGMAQLGVANTAYGMPYQNLAALLQPSVALAGLGSNTSGTSTGTQTSQGSLLGNIMGGITGGVGALGTTGAFGAGGWLGSLAPMLALSDVRAKEDIRPVGRLFDGQNVYSFRYKGRPETHVGFLAQEVERRDPGAVREIGGLKHVDYARALEPAARVGALAEAA